jgi:signal transduction histidine kinase
MTGASAFPSSNNGGGPLRAFQVPGHPWILAAGFTILVIMCGISVWLFDRAKEEADWVTHTMRVQGQLSELQLLIHRSTSSAYGFIVTGSRAYFDLYRRAVDEIPRSLSALKGSMADNPQEMERIAQIEPLIAGRLKQLEQPVVLATQGRMDAALDLQRTTDNTAESLIIVSLIDRMQAEEEDLLNARTVTVRDTRLWLLLVSLTGAALIVALAAVSVREVRRAAAVQREARRQLEQINISLEEKVQERTSALQTANQEIQRFAYIVSHDLRSPLVNIMGFTSELETLRQDLFDRMRDGGMPASTIQEIEQGAGKDFDESLNFIKTAIGKMDRLINAILRLSRVGHQEFKTERVDLDATLHAISDTLGHQLQTVDAIIEIQPLPTISADRLAIEQVFSNLLDNAVKYLRPGVKGEITVSSAEKGNFVVVRVADNGRGIDAKDSERIFELFRRSGRQDRPGEGIGLAHVRMLVRRMGGRINVESELGKGTTFMVILPRVMTSES